MEQLFFQKQAAEMVHRQARYLLRDTSRLTPQKSLPQVVSLINDCVHCLNLPTLAVEVALAFHPVVERWSAWGVWVVALDTALCVCRQVTSVSDEIRLLNYRSQAARELGDYGIAIKMATTALRLAEGQNNTALIAATLNKLGLIALKRDDLVAAQKYWEDALRCGQSLLSGLEFGHINLNLGVISVNRGMFTEAEHYFEHALQLYGSEHDVLHMAKVQCNIADLHRRQNRLSDVPEILLAALSTFKEMNARYDWALTQNDLGCAYLSLSKVRLALDAFKLAMEEFGQLGDLCAQARVLANMVELYVSAKNWNKATAVIKEACVLATTCEKPLLIARIAVDEGKMLSALGNHTQARQAWEKALVIQMAQGAYMAAQHTRQLIDNLSDQE